MISTKSDEKGQINPEQRIHFKDLISNIEGLTVESIQNIFRLGEKLLDGEVDLFDFEDITEETMLEVENLIFEVLLDNPKIHELAIASLTVEDFDQYASKTVGWEKRMGRWTKNNVVLPPLELEDHPTLAEKIALIRKVKDAEKIGFEDAWRRILNPY